MHFKTQSMRCDNAIWSALFGQNQFAEFGTPEAVETAVVFNPNFITTTGQIFEADDLWENRRWWC